MNHIITPFAQLSIDQGLSKAMAQKGETHTINSEPWDHQSQFEEQGESTESTRCCTSLNIEVPDPRLQSIESRKQEDHRNDMKRSEFRIWVFTMVLPCFYPSSPFFSPKGDLSYQGITAWGVSGFSWAASSHPLGKKPWTCQWFMGSFVENPYI